MMFTFHRNKRYAINSFGYWSDTPTLVETERMFVSRVSTFADGYRSQGKSVEVVYDENDGQEKVSCVVIVED